MNEKELRRVSRERLEAVTDADRTGCTDPGDLASLLDARTPEDSRITIMRHVAQCAACQRDLALLRGARDAARNLERRVGVGVPLALAASIALFAGAGIWWMARMADSDALRGGPADVQLVAPVGAVASPGPRQLVWRPATDAARYQAEVITVDGSPVFATTTADTIVNLPDAVSLRAGVDYRWWVSAVRDDGTTLRSAPASFHLRSP